MTQPDHQRLELHGAFGNDAFGRLAEKAARFFGTPQYIVGQTVAVLAWVVLNSTQLHLGFAWDVYPFIALNLLFSLQAAYAAPLILLAQTRQADRDKLHSESRASHNRLERHGEGGNRQDLRAAPVEHRAHPAGQGADRAGRRPDEADPRAPHETARELSTVTAPGPSSTDGKRLGKPGNRTREHVSPWPAEYVHPNPCIWLTSENFLAGIHMKLAQIRMTTFNESEKPNE